jgi:hypothetical protein
VSTFTSNFAPHIAAMLEWRTSLGHSLGDMRNAMTSFDRFCSSRHPSETVLTRNWRPRGARTRRRAHGAPTGAARSVSWASTSN